MPRKFCAPGRVNLIGEHTDYNDGFVMPAALDFSTTVSLTPRADRQLILHSHNFNERVAHDLNALPARQNHWSDYPIGVADVMQREGYKLRGAELEITGDLPLGAGLSSSASIEVATALALAANSDLEIERKQLALICRRAENEYVGARVGIMDQFASLFGRAAHALLLDCRSLEYELLPIPDNVRLIICNTMVKHELASSEYNERRAQCETGVRLLAAELPHVRALRDVSQHELEQFADKLPEVIFRRCRHIVTENARVLSAAHALKQNDLRTFGELMYESHRSLRDDFEVSCRELDVMVQLSSHVEGVYGSRMTGGGFGGCTISLVRHEQVEEFLSFVSNGYESQTQLKPEIYICKAANSAGEVTAETQRREL